MGYCVFSSNRYKTFWRYHTEAECFTCRRLHRIQQWKVSCIHEVPSIRELFGSSQLVSPLNVLAESRKMYISRIHKVWHNKCIHKAHSSLQHLITLSVHQSRCPRWKNLYNVLSSSLVSFTSPFVIYFLHQLFWNSQLWYFSYIKTHSV